LVRIGFGTDSHRFEHKKEKPLILGGVKITNQNGLSANSDGDVVLHALFNAISQACGGESLGYYADPLLKEGIVDSREYLKSALKMAKDLDYRINNIGVMIEAKRPYISMKDSKRMKKSIADIAEIDEDRIGITFTSGEGLTEFGRGKGIYVQAIVSLVKNDCKFYIE